ncbi:MAG: hypothetical protein HY243_11025 [Proteobacteria bacterium]|nr:hypothetical protein [Pseudomonadota bacterium]
MFEIKCKLEGAINPVPFNYEVNVQASTVTELSDRVAFPASITPTSIDWAWKDSSDNRFHLDGLSGRMR